MLNSGFSDIPWEASGLPISRDSSVTGLRKIFFKYREGFHWEWGVLKKEHIPKTQLSGLLIFLKKAVSRTLSPGSSSSLGFWFLLSLLRLFLNLAPTLILCHLHPYSPVPTHLTLGWSPHRLVISPGYASKLCICRRSCFDIYCHLPGEPTPPACVERRAGEGCERHRERKHAGLAAD